MKPRVFVSSVMEGFAAHREAARSGIIASGGEPVLIEGYPSQPVSSRTACLDAVASCDIYLAIIGRRGGWMTPAGKLVVEEEFEEAQRRGLPVLVFLEEVERDAEAQQLAKRLSDYVSGYYRRTYTTTAELKDLVEEALKPLMEGGRKPPMNPNWMNQALQEPLRDSGNATLQMVFGPERSDEVIDPVDLDSQEFKHRIFELAHRLDVQLFSYERRKTMAVRTSSLIVQQDGDQRLLQDVKLELTTSGVVQLLVNVSGQPEGSSAGIMRHLVVLEEDVRAGLAKGFNFVNALYNDLDPYQRHQRFYFNAALKNLNYRSLAASAPQGQSVTMRTHGSQSVLAFEPPKLITRRDLQEHEKQASVTLTLLRSQLQNQYA